MTKQRPIRTILLGLGALTSCALSQPVGRDFNNDGTLDFPVSITEYSETTLPKGAARLWSGASKQAIQTIVANTPNTLFGFSIESAGDIDADGFDDFVVGEPLWGTPDAWEGRVHVYSGQDGSSLLTITGPYPEIGLGRYVTGVGDWNGDGTNDIAASAWVTVDLFGTGTTDDGFGLVFIFSGVDGSILAEITDSAATEGFGYGLFPLGDINADGRADLAITDPQALGLSGTAAWGAIYIFNGSATPNDVLDLSDASGTIVNGDPSLRLFGAQIDVMHPNRWLSIATMQVLSLTDTDEEGGTPSSEFVADIIAVDGTFAGSKGIRPQLLDAGDIDINGVVDGEDLIASAGQYGTSPNAAGVMPVADIDKNGVIDASDVAYVLQSFGSTSNIFEDLWLDDRLRAIAGGSAGFGSMPGGSTISPSNGFQLHPIDDDCTFVIAFPPSMTSALSDLLIREGNAHCTPCPACDALDPSNCYACVIPGTVIRPTATPDDKQPDLGDTVTFNITPVKVQGRFTVYPPHCAGDGAGRECNNDRVIMPPWTIEVKDPDTGQWLLLKQSGNGNEPSVTSGTCVELRIILHPVTIPAEDSCPALVSDEIIEEVQFADFDITNEAEEVWPADRSRTIFAPLETVVLKTTYAGTVHQLVKEPSSIFVYPGTPYFEGNLICYPITFSDLAPFLYSRQPKII